MDIHHLGTFDVENYGDLLYPIVLCHLLLTRDPSLRIRQYSLLPGEAPHGAGFETHAIRDLFLNSPGEPLRLVIGGGDILRTDWNNLARHYGRHSRITRGWLRHSIGTAGLFGYRMRQRLPRQDAADFYARRFKARWMDYPAAGPFLITPEALPSSTVVHYVSCGVPHLFRAVDEDAVKQALDGGRSIYLRDQQSAEKLRTTGVSCKIHVAPDLAVLLSDQFDHATEALRGRQILSKMGLLGDRPVLCFQSQPYPGFSTEEINDQLQRYRERAGADVVLLPLGYCHGDHEFLQRLAAQSGGTCKYAPVDSIFDAISIIAASDVFVGTSLHGNITAFSYGIPHLLGPLPVDKAEGFLQVTNLPPQLKLDSWREIDDKLDLVRDLGRPFFLERARAAKSQVRKVLDDVFENLLEPGLPLSASCA